MNALLDCPIPTSEGQASAKMDSRVATNVLTIPSVTSYHRKHSVWMDHLKKGQNSKKLQKQISPFRSYRLCVQGSA